MSESKVAHLLRSAFLRLKKKNELVSIRSIAANLKLSNSYLSKILRGERAVSPKLLGRLARVLQLDHHEAATIQGLLLGQIENRDLARTTGVKIIDEKKLSNLSQEYAALGAADFWLLEDWYHLPILNLVTTEDFDSSPEWIAKRLGISAKQAEQSLQRSKAAGYLRLEDQILRRTDLKLRFPTQRSYEKVRGFHHAMGKKALEILKKAPTELEFSERLISGVAFAGDPAKIAQAKVVIEEAIYKAAEILAGGKCTEVFQLNLQLFKLTSKT